MGAKSEGDATQWSEGAGAGGGMADPFAVQAGARGAGRRIRGGGGGGVKELGTGVSLGHGKVAHEIIALLLSFADAQKISRVLLARRS